ncbi:MAG: HIT domain-containing protein [Gammaproteobacteria bacterium]|nr:HIT domain-containing protein [Pseudomonadales bacterium]MCP5348107.1 HIT domain-containing protein [Pseudomonadales bacterium]
MTEHCEFKLDPALARDCHQLGNLHGNLLLLMNNALVPWFILVPQTNFVELCDLPLAQRQALNLAIDEVSRCLRQYWPVDKLNVAAIGNVVRQLHVHVVGRQEGDYCWPGVVWGRPEREVYTTGQVDGIRQRVESSCSSSFSRLANP